MCGGRLGLQRRWRQPGKVKGLSNYFKLTPLVIQLLWLTLKSRVAVVPPKVGAARGRPVEVEEVVCRNVIPRHRTRTVEIRTQSRLSSEPSVESAVVEIDRDIGRRFSFVGGNLSRLSTDEVDETSKGGRLR